MADLKYFGNGIPVAAGFDLNSKTPLDARTVAANLEQLQAMDDIKIYVGLKVFVESEQCEYTYKISGYNEETNPDTQEVTSVPVYGWVKDNTSTNLENLSTEFESHVSAYNEKVEELTGKDTELQGSINTINTTLETLSSKDTELANTIQGVANDLSAHTEANATALNALTDEDTRLAGLISDLTTDLSDLDTLHSSDIAAIDAAYKAADVVLDEKINTSVQNISTTIGELDTAYKAEDTRLAGLIQTNADDIATLQTSLNETITQVNTNTSAIETLNGDEFTEGSVKKAIADSLVEITEDLSEASSKKVVMENVNLTEGQTVIQFGAIIPEEYSISKDAIKVHINGLTYVEVLAFTINRSSRVITWTMTSSNGGFDLEADDTCVVEYTIIKRVATEETNFVAITNVEEIKTDNGVNFGENPDEYVEYIDLSSYTINNFLGITINGVQYTTDDYVSYDAETQVLTLRGVNTKAEDTINVMDSVAL